MDIFNIKVTQRVRLAALILDEGEIRYLCEVAMASIQARAMRGLDVHDGSVAPLKKKYLRRKTRRGLSPIPDLSFTGDMWRSMRIMSAQRGKGVIGFEGEKSIIKAYVNHARRKQLGVSPANEKDIAAAAHAMVAVYVQRAVQVVAGIVSAATLGNVLIPEVRPASEVIPFPASPGSPRILPPGVLQVQPLFQRAA